MKNSLRLAISQLKLSLPPLDIILNKQQKDDEQNQPHNPSTQSKGEDKDKGKGGDEDNERERKLAQNKQQTTIDLCAAFQDTAIRHIENRVTNALNYLDARSNNSDIGDNNNNYDPFN